MVRFALFAFLAVAYSNSASPLGAQAASSAGARVFTLRGTVLNGKTGEPLPRTLVATGDRRLAALTDKDGHFSIDVEVTPYPNGESPSLTLRLLATKPGYFPSGQPAEISLGHDSAALASLRLTLMPAASITGEVFVPADDASSRLRIILLRHQALVGDRRWVIASSDTPDEDGTFRFGSLEPDEYTLLATEQPKETPSLAQVTAGLRPTFAGDTVDINTASKLRLHYGDAPHVPIHLLATTLVPVAIPVAAPAGTLSVQATVVSPFLPEASPLSYTEKRGLLTGLLPKGSYQILLTGYGTSGPSYGSVSLQVNASPLQTGPVPLEQPDGLRVRIHQEFHPAAGNPTPVNTVGLTLFEESTAASQQHNGASQNGQDFTIPSVSPGRYRAFAFTSKGYVAEMRAAGTDLMHLPLTLGAGVASAPIDLIVRDDTGTVTGTIAHADAALPDHSVLVAISLEGSQEPRIASVEKDGSFKLDNLPPGSYLLFALPQMMPEAPYREPQWLEQLRGKAVTITLPANGAVQSIPPLLKESDLPELP